MACQQLHRASSNSCSSAKHQRVPSRRLPRQEHMAAAGEASHPAVVPAGDRSPHYPALLSVTIQYLTSAARTSLLPQQSTAQSLMCDVTHTSNPHPRTCPPPTNSLPLCPADAANPFGSGCPKGEGCCSTTNTCVKITSCADFTRVCPPSTCGKDLSFSEITVRRKRLGAVLEQHSAPQAQQQHSTCAVTVQKGRAAGT